MAGVRGWGLDPENPDIQDQDLCFSLSGCIGTSPSHLVSLKQNATKTISSLTKWYTHEFERNEMTSE